MADEQLQLATPDPGRKVDDNVLVSNGLTSFGGMRAYSGTADPRLVWAAMFDDTREAIGYYRELEVKDDTVADAMEEMKRSVLKRNITVVPVDESSSQAAEIASFVQSQFDNLANWRSTLEAMLDAPFMGFSVAEQVFDISSGQVSLLDIRDCPQELFSFNDPMLPPTGQLRLHMNGADYAGTKVAENKFVVWSSRMRAGNRKGRALLREVYWPSWVNRNVQRFWLRLAERGPGVAVATFSEGATVDEQRKALTAAEALVTQVAMAIPETMEIREELLKAARTGDPAVFAQLSDRMEDKIIRRIVGSTLTSKGSAEGKGTQALGKVHENTKDERSVEYALQLESILNSQVVSQLVLWNYGPAAAAVRVRLDKSDEEDLGARITVDSTAQQMGVPITVGYMQNKYGFSAPKDGEQILVRSTAPPMASLTSPAGPPDAPQFADGGRLARWWRERVESTGEQPTLDEVLRVTTYAEGGDPTITRQVHREQSDFDKLFSQFRKKGAEIYTGQIDELAREASQRRGDA